MSLEVGVRMGLIPYRTGTVPKILDTENLKNSIPNTELSRSIRYRYFGTTTPQSQFYTLQLSNFDCLKLDIEGVDQLQEIGLF